jgi:hypothetical protein
MKDSPAIKRVKVKEMDYTHPEKYLVFEIPKHIRESLTKLIKRSIARADDHYHLILGLPKKPRTMPQNRCVWGWCQDLAEQMQDAYEGYSIAEIKERIYEAMKRLAVQEAGWPTVINPIDGTIEPISQSLVSVEQDNALIKIIQRFADEHGFYLTERIEGIPVKTIGGEPKNEE